MKKVVLLLLTLLALAADAQEQVYPLYQYVPLVLQPAAPAQDYQASLGFVNRRTFLSSGLSYQQNAFAAEMPFVYQKSGRRIGGIGAYVVQKDAGSSDLLKALNAGVSLAYNLQLSREHSIAFGMLSSYNDRQTTLERLTTGSQWLADEFRFDPDADMGETVLENRVQYFSVSANLGWQWADLKTGRVRATVGATSFNLNTPDDSFLEGRSSVPVSYLAYGGMMVYHGPRLEVQPHLFYYHSEAGGEMNFFLTTRWLFENENPYDIIRSGSIELITQYDFDNSASIGVAFSQPGMSIGFSYAIPTASESNQFFRNATEMGIRITKTLWKEKAETIVIQNTPLGPTRSFNFNNAQPQQPAVAPKSDADVIQEKIGSLDKVTSVRFELDKDFKFSFGSAVLPAEAKRYLDELYEMLASHPDYKLEVTGHTDNVGKHQVNFRLSTARAQAVATYLMEKGISPDRIKHGGRGDTEPLAPNDSEENRSKNRRVHFTIYVERQ